MPNVKNKYGQYMTPELVANFMVSLSNLNTNSDVLEPCSGEGVFITALKNKKFNNITAYEIDGDIVNKNDNVIINSFVSAQTDKNFDLIIGNPPYIRWKNLEEELKTELSDNNYWKIFCNSLCDYSSVFILKSIDLLKEGGELIFITPEYWLNTTHSIKLRNYMIENGYFEQIYHFNETPIFYKATVSLIIFKYIKGKRPKNSNIKIAKFFSKKKLSQNILDNLKDQIKQDYCEYIEIPQFEKDKNWILASKEIVKELSLFENKCKKKNTNNLYLVKEFCDIGNGMVSGLDKAFQINGFGITDDEKKQTIKVIKAKHLKPFSTSEVTDYIFINDVNSEADLQNSFPNFYSHLQKFKDDLDKRYQYSKKIEYWKWVFLRNYKLFDKKISRIFVPCKERISNKNYFRFAYVKEGIFPTQDVTAIFKKEETQESLFYILAILNSTYVFDWLLYNGIVKGSIVEFSEKPIANIPFRKIDFTNLEESKIHDEISKLTEMYIQQNNKETLEKINNELTKLFK